MMKNNSISITVKFFADLRQFGPVKALIDLPENSTIKSILEKYKIPKEYKRLIILINGIPSHTQKGEIYLKDGDIIAIFPPLAGG